MAGGDGTGRARALVAMGVVVCAFGGCGGHSATAHKGQASTSRTAPNPAPRAKETIEQFADRMRVAFHAAASGDCATVRSFLSKATIALSCGDATARREFEAFQTAAAQSFGTGGIVDVTFGVARQRATIVAALNNDGRYYPLHDLELSRALPFQGVRLNAWQAGTSPLNASRQALAAQTFIDAMRRDDCRTLRTVWGRFVYLRASNKRLSCTQVYRTSGALLHSDLVAAPRARPVLLGGVQAVSFYRVVTGLRYRTLVVIPSQSNVFLVDSYRSDA